MKVRVTGMKFFKGEVEGTNYDSTTVFIETKIDDRNGRGRGTATQDYKCGDSTVYAEHLNLQLPADMDIEFENVTTGKKTTQIIRNISAIKASAADPHNKFAKVG